jgi:hypothetical protein
MQAKRVAFGGRSMSRVEAAEAPELQKNTRADPVIRMRTRVLQNSVRRGATRSVSDLSVT